MPKILATAKPKTKTVEKEKPVTVERTLKDIQREIYAKRFDQMEKKFAITSQEINVPNKLSSGLLMIDLVSGGGLTAGKCYGIAGPEKGSKTTSAYHYEGQAVRKEIPAISHYDAEGAVSDPDYVKATTGFTTRELYFGSDKKVRLYQESGLEDFYDTSKMLMRSLPDKQYRSEEKQWFHIFDSDQAGRANMSDFGYKSYNKKLYGETGRLFCETDQVGLQGLIVIDSYAALLIKKIDDGDDVKQLPAAAALAFSNNIKKVLGVLSRKAFSIYGINQLRTNPMAMFGSPFYEPCGDALKFASSVRNQTRPMSCPADMFPGVDEKGQKVTSFGQEPSVYGKGTDKYHYVKMTNTKNRLGTPGLSSMMRVWFKDGLGTSHGYDIAYDTLQYLDKTGRIDGSPKRKMKVMHPSFDKITPLTWDEFKLMILSHTDPILMKRARTYFENVKVIPNIRPELFKEIRTKAAYKLLVENGTKNLEDLEAS